MISVFKKFLSRRVLGQVGQRLLSEQLQSSEVVKLKELPLYVNHYDHFKVSKVKTVEKIAELFDLKRGKALELVMKNEKYFFNVPVYNIGENYYECISSGLNKELLLKYPRILSTSNVKYKMDLVRKIPYSLEITASLLILDFKTLKRFVAKELVEYNISTVANLLEVSEVTVCEWYGTKKLVITSKYDLIEKNFHLLKANGVSREEIIADLWVLRYSTEYIQNRLDFATDNHTEKFKTWMVRCPMSVIDMHVKRQCDTKSILGDDSIIEYLSKRLQCSQLAVRIMIKKHPAIRTKRLRRLNEMIDFLMLCGFSTSQICRSAKILLHSIETVKARLKELDNYGKKLDSLHVLTKSKKQFSQFCEQIKANITKN